ncbi:MAG: PrsW family intramembrane metalloprotease [Nocardioidaceae bacterium]
MSRADGFGGVRPGAVDPSALPPQGPAPVPPPELLRRPRRTGSLWFTVVVAAALFAGAVMMALVLLASNAPDALVVGVLLAALPVGPVVAAYLWLDRYEPEPLRLLALAFGWGAVVATAGALVLQSLDRAAFGTSANLTATTVAPVTEEAAKGLFILLLLWWRRADIDGVLDGIVYAGMVGVGFAFTENILYLGGAYMGGHDGPGGFGAATYLFVVRGVFSPFAHPLFTSLLGIGVGVAVVTRSRLWRFLAPLLGYVAAVAAHASWNASAALAGRQMFLLTYVFAMVPAFLLVAGFAVWARGREGRMLTRSLTDCADRGFLAHGEVPWLVRLPARRECRRQARADGGRVAERVMREYQQQAVELGFLHDRYLRGTAPADFVARGSSMVLRLQALRPYVRFPGFRGVLR